MLSVTDAESPHVRFPYASLASRISQHFQVAQHISDRGRVLLI